MSFAHTCLAALVATATIDLSLAQEREPAGDDPRAALARLPRVPRRVEEEELEENNDRREQILRSCMAPDAYLDGLDKSGMLAALGSGDQQLGTGWTPLGPFGDYSSRNGRVAGIQLVSTGPGQFRVYVGSCAGGVWFSDLASLGVWTSIGDGLMNPSVRALHVDPTNTQNVVVGTGDPERWTGGGMFRTTNGGDDWNPVTLPVSTPGRFYRITAAPGLPAALLGACDQGLLASTNGGAAWVTRQAGHCTDVIWHPTDASRGWACFKGEGIRRTVNGGADWVTVSDADFPPANQWGRASIAICRDDPDVIAVLVEQNGGVRAVLRTEDGGTDWTDVTGSLLNFGTNQATHAQAIAIKPDDGERMYVGTIKIARTENGGATWLTGASGVPNGHDDVTQLHFDAETGDEILWICNDGGIYTHFLGGSSTSSANGSSPTGLNVAQIAYIDANRAMQAIGLQDNGVVRSRDAGQSWEHLHSGDGGYVEITDPESERLWWADGIYMPPPTWRSYRKVGNGGTQDFGNPDSNSMSLFHDPWGDRMYTAGWQKLWSVDEDASAGTAWTLELDLGANVPNGIWTMSGSEADGRTLYIAHREPSGGPPPDLRLSICRRNASNWSQWHRVLPAPGAKKVWSITPSLQWPGECWVAVDGGLTTPKVLHTTDLGATWEDLTSNLAGLTVRRVMPRPFDPLTLYAATDVGMYVSSDGGGSWQPFQEGLAMAPCFDLAFVVDPSFALPNRLVLATQGRGVWVREIASPPILWVDSTNTSGSEDGTFEHPHDTIGEAVAAAPPGAIVAVRADTYSAPLTITKNLRVVTWAGTTAVE